MGQREQRGKEEGYGTWERKQVLEKGAIKGGYEGLLGRKGKMMGGKDRNGKVEGGGERGG